MNDENSTWTPDNGEVKAAPSVTVLGVLAGGKLVKPDWTVKGVTHQMSDRTIAALSAIGVVVNDDPANYLF